MADELLPYYEKELAYIRQLGAEFSKEHPKIAGRLGVNAEVIEDPHVSRLIESFSYLNARIQHKLDDDFPELSDALLNVIFPHYQRPIPSMSIVQFEPDKEQLNGKYLIEKNTLLETEYFQGENCRFTSTYDVELHPIQVTDASIVGRPFNTPGSDAMRGAGGVLKISLETFTPDLSFSDMSIDSLRFYLKGQPQHTQLLYHLMLSGCQGITLSTPDSTSLPVFLSSDAICDVGFSREEGILPYPENSFIGYRLLTEYFVFPEKFMFLNINKLNKELPEDVSNRLDIYIYLDTTDVELEHNISASTFMLGCTPVVNLFNMKTDPIKLDHTRSEYQIVADSRRPLGYEVYSVDSVHASTPTGESVEYLPFYGLSHRHQDPDKYAFWLATRRSAKLNDENRDEGSDVFLGLVNLNFDPNIPQNRTLNINTTCSNRDQPAKLPFNSTQPQLQCVDGAPPCHHIRCITQPSATIRPPLRNRARWRLLSHLNLNHLSITGGENATQALKEILRLYDFKESSVTRALIESIVSVDARSISAPLNIDGRATMCRGIEVEILLDGNQLSGSSSYLYASILERFFSLYCSVNSFTRTLVKLKNKEGYLKKCPPRAGEKVLL